MTFNTRPNLYANDVLRTLRNDKIVLENKLDGLRRMYEDTPSLWLENLIAEDEARLTAATTRMEELLAPIKRGEEDNS